MAKNGVGRLTKAQELERDKKLLEEEKFALKWQKHMANIEELKKHIQKLEEENRGLNEKIESLERNALLFNTDEDKIKKILEFRAQNDDVIMIKDRLEYIGISSTLEEIDRICLNKDSLGVEYVKFFDSCAKKFEEEIEINPKVLKNKALQNTLFNIDMTKKAMLGCEDPQMLSKMRTELDTYTKTQMKVLESGIVTNEDNSYNMGNNLVVNMMEDYEEQKSKVIKLNLEDIKAI